jgi:hypothetical protein
MLNFMNYSVKKFLILYQKYPDITDRAIMKNENLLRLFHTATFQKPERKVVHVRKL